MINKGRISNIYIYIAYLPEPESSWYPASFNRAKYCPFTFPANEQSITFVTCLEMINKAVIYEPDWGKYRRILIPA